MKKGILAVLLLFALIISSVSPVFAALNMVEEATRNEGITVVPAPGPVTIDGDFSDWDWS